jgi:hypothetical protein
MFLRQKLQSTCELQFQVGLHMAHDDRRPTQRFVEFAVGQYKVEQFYGVSIVLAYSQLMHGEHFREEISQSPDVGLF